MPGEFEELINKATAEDLVTEAWDVNLTICDKVGERGGEEGARAKEVVGLLVKRLSHRNPNVQLFTLELANSLVQNTSDTTRAEISSRAWTGALDRLVSDRTTNPEVKKRTLKFVKEWAADFSKSDLGVMKDLYDGLRARNISFDEPAKPAESEAAARARQEEEELQRVLELSKQDKGGRGGYDASQRAGGAAGSGSGSGSGSGAAAAPGYYQAAPNGHHAPTHANSGSSAGGGSGPRPYPAREPTPPPAVPSKATASRVRAIYPFVTSERGELSFERGDVIKVIDRMYDEWYTGAVGGRIGIFPISYVEPLPDPTAEELQREAQDEARVFAAQGMIVNLQRTLDSLDPSRGDRLDDPELEEMYQKAVALQPQIVALMKKYADQKAELEHIHASFVKAQMQYTRMSHPQAQMPAPHPAAAAAAYPGYGMDPAAYAAAGAVPQAWPTHHATAVPEGYESYDSNASSNATVVPGQAATAAGQDPAAQEAARAAQEQHAAAWAAYYAAQAQQAQALQAQQQQAGGASPQQAPPAGPVAQAAQAQGGEAAPAGQTQAERDHIAAWQAYYAAQAQQAQAMAAQGQPGYAPQGQADGHAERVASPPADGRYDQQAGYADPRHAQGAAQHPYAAAGPGSTSVNSLHSQHAAPQQHQQAPQLHAQGSYTGRPTSGYGQQGYEQQPHQPHQPQSGLEHGMAQMGIQQGQPRG